MVVSVGIRDPSITGSPTPARPIPEPPPRNQKRATAPRISSASDTSSVMKLRDRVNRRGNITEQSRGKGSLDSLL
jgi:hypothetical protein